MKKKKPGTKNKKNAQSITVDFQSSYNLVSNQYHRAVTPDRSNNINTPRKKFKTQHTNTPADPTRAHGYSSDSSADGIQECALEDLVLSVRESINNGFIILISNSRPKTLFGKKQEDHVSAFASFIEMIVAASEDRRAKDVGLSLYNIGISLMPEKTSVFQSVLSNFPSQHQPRYSRMERKALTRRLRNYGENHNDIERLKVALKYAEKAEIKDIIQEMGETFLRQLNIDDTISFRKVGAVDRTEGARVRKATHALKAISDIVTISYTNNDVCDQEMDYFYENYLKKGAKYKDGFNAIAGEKVAKNFICALDSYHDIDHKKLALRDYSINVTNDKIASFFGDLFDFNYQKHKSKNIDLLYRVVARHIVIMLHAFNGLQKLDYVPDIIDTFLSESVLKSNEWDKKPRFTKNDLSQGILRHAEFNVDIKRFAMLTEEEKQRNSLLNTQNYRQNLAR